MPSDLNRTDMRRLRGTHCDAGNSAPLPQTRLSRAFLFRSFQLTPMLPVTLLLAVNAMTAGCGKTDKAATGKSEPPAKVVKDPSETELSVLHLTAKAVERLGITLAPVSMQSIQRHRNLGGEVLIPPGNTVIVSAPLAGTLTAPEGKLIPLPGDM